jgi:dTDP-4-amino-4,6-dideoxygalactose transaminase
MLWTSARTQDNLLTTQTISPELLGISNLELTVSEGNKIMKIPFLDLNTQYQTIKDEIDEALRRVIKKTAFVLGEEVELFEAEFAVYCDAKYCVGVNSGTSALHLALLAHDIGKGDEVITVPNTFIATCEAISYTGARPVFVDIDPKTYNIDVTRIEKAITKNTKAIIPVHLYGQPADMAPILDIAKKHNLIVIEDACQAHGAEYKGNHVGAMGNAGAFSFYPGKNLGAYGEGGAVVTNDETIYKKVKMFRDHGQNKKYHHDVIGYNYRMDGFQGAVLRVKLRHLDSWIELRRKNARLYNQFFKGSDVIIPFEPEYAKSVYHLYVIRTRKRDELQNYLTDIGISTGLHYPIPIHLQNAYQFLGYTKGTFPVAEQYAGQILSLPMFPELQENDIQLIANSIKEFLE